MEKTFTVYFKNGTADNGIKRRKSLVIPADRVDSPRNFKNDGFLYEDDKKAMHWINPDIIAEIILTGF